MSSTDIYVPALPQIVKDLQTIESYASFSLVSYMIGFALSMLLSGTLSDSFGRRKILFTFISFYILSSFLLSTTRSIEIFIILRFFQGIFGGCGTVVGRLIVSDLYPVRSDQLNVMSTLSIGMALAPAIAPQLGAILSEFISWRACFVVSGMLGFLILLILQKIHIHPNELIKQSFRLSPLLQLPQSFVNVFRYSPHFNRAAILITSTWCAYFTFIGLSSFYYQEVFQYSQREYAYVISIMTSGYLLGTSLTKYLNKRLVSINQIIQYGQFIFIGASLLTSIQFFFFKSAVLLTVSMTIMRIGIGLIMPSSQVMALNHANNQQGWSMGCLLFLEFAFGGFAVYCASLLDQLSTGLGVFVITTCSATLILLVLSRKMHFFRWDISADRSL